METAIYCQGCGVSIQTTAKDELGYTPKSSLEREVVLCQRCFRLKHYNETQEISMTDDDFLKMISDIRNHSGIVVHLIDIFDVNGSLIPSLSRIVGEKNIILVGNKLDLLPKSMNHNKLIHWLKSTSKASGLKVQDAFLISSVKGTGIEELTYQIEKLRRGENVYIVGTTNVGKSTFINKVIKQSIGEENVITTSYFPGTTLGFIEIPLDDEAYLIDTPGIVNKQQMVHHVSKKDLKYITPTKEVKARTYQLNSGQTLFIGGLARFDFMKGNRQSFICYFSNEIPIHRTKLENADQLYENHLGKLLSPPDSETIEKLPPLVESTFKITEERTDIVFPGLGWISIEGDGATVAAHSPKGVSVSMRKSWIGV